MAWPKLVGSWDRIPAGRPRVSERWSWRWPTMSGWSWSRLPTVCTICVRWLLCPSISKWRLRARPCISMPLWLTAWDYMPSKPSSKTSVWNTNIPKNMRLSIKRSKLTRNNFRHSLKNLSSRYVKVWARTTTNIPSPPVRRVCIRSGWKCRDGISVSMKSTTCWPYGLCLNPKQISLKNGSAGIFILWLQTFIVPSPSGFATGWVCLKPMDTKLCTWRLWDLKDNGSKCRSVRNVWMRLQRKG